MRHGSIDIWTFNELFVLRLYEPPDPIAAMLAEVREPRVLDLGANIGLFGIDARSATRVPASPRTSPTTRARRSTGGSSSGTGPLARGGSWRRVRGPDRARSRSSLDRRQRVASSIRPTAGTVTLPMEDVLPAFADADLVKLDIEGGEWSLLEDPRFAAARIVVLEYHPPGCPDEDTHATATRLLEEHGYEVFQLFKHPGGVGMAWAVRPAGRG